MPHGAHALEAAQEKVMSGVRLMARVKNLSQAPYTQEEAERAAGMGSFIAPAPVAVPSMQELHAIRQNLARSLPSD